MESPVDFCKVPAELPPRMRPEARFAVRSMRQRRANEARAAEERREPSAQGARDLRLQTESKEEHMSFILGTPREVLLGRNQANIDDPGLVFLALVAQTALELIVCFRQERPSSINSGVMTKAESASELICTIVTTCILGYLLGGDATNGKPAPRGSGTEAGAAEKRPGATRAARRRRHVQRWVCPGGSFLEEFDYGDRP